MKLIRDFAKGFPTKLLEELFFFFSNADNLVCPDFPRTLGTVVRCRFWLTGSHTYLYYCIPVYEYAMFNGGAQ